MDPSTNNSDTVGEGYEELKELPFDCPNVNECLNPQPYLSVKPIALHETKMPS